MTHWRRHEHAQVAGQDGYAHSATACGRIEDSDECVSNHTEADCPECARAVALEEACEAMWELVPRLADRIAGNGQPDDFEKVQEARVLLSKVGRGRR